MIDHEVALEDQICSNCKFYYMRTKIQGLCRRYAPKPVAITDSSDIFWKQPDVFYEDWCGEWEFKSEAH